MTISINQIESGTALLIGGDIFLVTEYNHVKPGKGAAFVRVKLRNVKTQQVLERTYRSADKLDDIHLEERKLQFLYRGADTLHFMDFSIYEQIEVSADIIGDGVRFLQENMDVIGLCHDHQFLKIELPTFFVAEITHSEPGFKGDSSKAGTKPATIDTGTTIQVPLFINTGDKIKIDTRSGTYVERVK